MAQKKRGIIRQLVLLEILAFFNSSSTASSGALTITWPSKLPDNVYTPPPKIQTILSKTTTHPLLFETVVAFDRLIIISLAAS